ncbi:Gfo/Idh/MocA family oxidoreductase [Pelagibacterium sp. 26DY04]|uniref:Gfo/Idh/MocA family protein n=1 Tax=unclassified Pelagibacterium TaxID=2623280 RepID=UPI00281611DF|nr:MULTISPECIES: Gfo/Idh/MocA family oxidoreductase [unclassified Pelagibacterium]WMT87606.1 Gfo/Idh/MocA family oxidoreductase [Pelagibacterium sp. 26DY04]WMT91625.1 Gfo/Idh/MocA family oxidoreductase [Pelagibacterium sp. H642]
MTSLGVGLIGTGYMGKCHALAWNAVAPVFGDVARPRLVHLAEANADLAARQAQALGFERATGDWRDLIADPEVDVVSITTPNAFHPEMAIAALQAGKHVWCEKPMAPHFADAEHMAEAAKASGRVAVLGYNYIQNPLIRHVQKLLAEGAIGIVHSVRVEMDEDFMADPAALFSWKSEASSGYGALDDFGVHPLSILTTLLGPVEKVMADFAKPFATRPTADDKQREVETFDIANILLRLSGGIAGAIQLSRSAWGRKGRIALQIFGSDGTIAYDQERMNELQLFTREGRAAEQGFRTVLTAPIHSPYDKFIPAPGHGLGFNDLKIIEAREVMRAISGEPAHIIDFETGLTIERTVHAMAHSHRDGRWVSL